MDKYINSEKINEVLPTCRIITKHDEIYEMIASILDGYFTVTKDDNRDLTITDSGHSLIFSSKGNAAEEVLERPFSPAALLSVAKSMTARKNRTFSSDSTNRLAILGDISVQLTETEFRLYEILLGSGNMPVSAEVMSASIWGKYDRNLCTVHLSNLRRKLDFAFGDGTLISVRGKGYALRRTN